MGAQTEDKSTSPDFALPDATTKQTNQSLPGVVGQQYCSASTVKFTVEDASVPTEHSSISISKGQGEQVFTVDRKAWNLRDTRVLNSAVGKPVCTMQAKIFSFGRRWTLFMGSQQEDSSIVGTFDRAQKRSSDGVTATLTGSKGAEIVLKCQNPGFWSRLFGTEVFELLHQGQAMAQVTQKQRGWFSYTEALSYEVVINAGYDHAFVLCLCTILDVFRFPHPRRAW